MGVDPRLADSRLTEPFATNEEPNAQAPRRIGDVVANVGNRVQEILDSAERVAGEIRSEAEAEAKRYLDERRREADLAVADRLREFTDLSQSMAQRVESLQREAALLTEALDEARRSFDADLAASANEAADTPIRQELRPTEDPEAVSDPVPVPDQAILRATQMAVAGTDRAQIEIMLRTDFGIDDPAAVVNRMLRSGRA